MDMNRLDQQSIKQRQKNAFDFSDISAMLDNL
jgi:hypothetical protein